MPEVFLTSGPRGAGKSTYVKEFLENHPEIKLISRDQTLIDLYGSTETNPYCRGAYVAINICFDKIKKLFNQDENVCIILDFWNLNKSDRDFLIQKLKELGADKIHCWFFITPIETCLKWFFLKPDCQKYSIDAVKKDYALFHREALLIRENGFDSIMTINPTQRLLF